MSKQNSNKITVANIVSILGLVAMAVLVYLGYSFSNAEAGGNIGTNILIASACIIITGGLLVVLIHAKGVENNFKGWLIVEIIALCLFIGASFYPSSQIMHYFVIQNQKEDLMELAKEDIENIKGQVELFKSQEAARLGINYDGIKHALGHNKYDETVKTFLEAASISSLGSAEEWKGLKAQEINHIELDGRTYDDEINSTIRELTSIIDNWTLFEIPQAAYRIKTESENISRYLSQISENLGFKTIESTTNEKGQLIYTANESDSNSYEICHSFPEEFEEANGFSIIGLLMVILINLVILFNYLVAYRSRKARKNAKVNIGGTPLY